MRETPSTVINDLVRLGSFEATDVTETPEICARLVPFDWVDRLDWQSWDAAAMHLTQEDLKCLGRGLVRAEKIDQWGGGSVAGAIWVFKTVQRRFPQDADALAEWMLANSGNPWIPFGSNRGSARSLVELERHNIARAEHRRARENDAELKRRLRQVRENVRLRLAIERRAIQAGASSARQQLLNELRSLSIRERIEHLAWDDFHPLEFYPAELLQDGPQQLCEADATSLYHLLSKAVLQRTGPWRTWLADLRKQCAGSGCSPISRIFEDLCQARPRPEQAKTTVHVADPFGVFPVDYVDRNGRRRLFHVFPEQIGTEFGKRRRNFLVRTQPSLPLFGIDRAFQLDLEEFEGGWWRVETMDQLGNTAEFGRCGLPGEVILAVAERFDLQICSSTFGEQQVPKATEVWKRLRSRVNENPGKFKVEEAEGRFWLSPIGKTYVP